MAGSQLEIFTYDGYTSSEPYPGMVSTHVLLDQHGNIFFNTSTAIFTMSSRSKNRYAYADRRTCDKMNAFVLFVPSLAQDFGETQCSFLFLKFSPPTAFVDI